MPFPAPDFPHPGGRLLDEWQKLSVEGLNNRAIAARLGVTEASLLDAGRGILSWRLRTDAAALFEAARHLGMFKMVLRNDFAVLERPGAVSAVSFDGSVVSVQSSTFRLRVDATAIHSAFALGEAQKHGDKRSVQLFDAAGVSIAKIVLRPESDSAAFEALIRNLSLHEALPVPGLVAPPAARVPVENAREAVLADFLHHAARLALPLRIAVSNPHATLQAADTIHRIKRSARAPWINVLDPALDMHLHEARIGRLAVEPLENGAARFRWLADDGTEAFCIEAPGADALAAAAMPAPG